MIFLIPHLKFHHHLKGLRLLPPNPGDPRPLKSPPVCPHQKVGRPLAHQVYFSKQSDEFPRLQPS